MDRTEIVKCSGTDGRIRIPKTIRKSLEISGSEPLVLKVDGRRLILEKYREMETLESVCRLYLRAFAKSSRSPAVICDTERILAAKGCALPQIHGSPDS